MRYAMHAREARAGALFDRGRGCERFTQRLVALTDDRCEGAGDEVLYVLAGRGRARCGEEVHELAPGTAVFAARETSWSVEADEPLEAVSVVVHDPEPAEVPFAVVDTESAGEGAATAGRAFLLGATPEVGCASATQFVGLIPPGRAPDHFHRYDEVIYVLDGEGELEIGGERAPLEPGSCVHLPARLVHCLANTGERELRVLGVFRPAGSPAEAYYPDGTLAVVPES